MDNTTDFDELQKRHHIHQALTGLPYFEAPQSGIPPEVLAATILDQDLADDLDFAIIAAKANKGEDDHAANYWQSVAACLQARLKPSD